MVSISSSHLAWLSTSGMSYMEIRSDMLPSIDESIMRLRSSGVKGLAASTGLLELPIPIQRRSVTSRANRNASR